MLSDEEKKAIERLDYFELDDLIECAMYRDCVETIKKLIEKQSKEIEELNSDLEVFKRGLTDIEVVYNKNYISKDKIKAKIEEKFLEAKGLYERGVQPQAQYTMKLLRDLEKSLLEKE